MVLVVTPSAQWLRPFLICWSYSTMNMWQQTNWAALQCSCCLCHLYPGKVSDIRRHSTLTFMNPSWRFTIWLCVAPEFGLGFLCEKCGTEMEPGQLHVFHHRINCDGFDNVLACVDTLCQPTRKCPWGAEVSCLVSVEKAPKFLILELDHFSPKGRHAVSFEVFFAMRKFSLIRLCFVDENNITSMSKSGSQWVLSGAAAVSSNCSSAIVSGNLAVLWWQNCMFLGAALQPFESSGGGWNAEPCECPCVCLMWSCGRLHT